MVVCLTRYLPYTSEHCHDHRNGPMRPLATPRKKTLIAILAAVALLLVFTATVGSVPGACGTCHAMKPFAEALESSAHANVSCYECHAAPSTGGWAGMKWRELTRMYVPGLLGAKVDGPGTHIERSRCLACHEDVLSAAVGTRGLRINHSACASDIDCGECHSSVAHAGATRWVRQPSMTDCISCHSASDGPDACDSCHEGQLESERLVSGPWQVTHGPNWQETHGMGDLRSCTGCHPADYCVDCHGVSLPHPVDFPARHGADALASREFCTACHDEAALCDACHGMPMPHPDDFLAEHSTLVTSTADPSCTTCHHESDCLTCHEAHIHPGGSDGFINSPLPRPGGGS